MGDEHGYHCDYCDILPVRPPAINTLRPRQNVCHFPDNIFKCISLNENIWITIETSPKFVSKGAINNIPALVQIMAWRRLGDKPLSEPTMSLLTHICVTWPQWVNVMSSNATTDYNMTSHHAQPIVWKKHYHATSCAYDTPIVCRKYFHVTSCAYDTSIVRHSEAWNLFEKLAKPASKLGHE